MPSAATGLEFECFFLSLLLKISCNLALTMMPLHNKSRENRVMSYQTFLTSGQDATWLLFRLGQIWEKRWNMMPRQLFVLLNCYISQHTLRVIFCLSLTLHFELIKASISMTWCHHSLSLSYFITVGFQRAGSLSLMPNAHYETEGRHTMHIQRLSFLFSVAQFTQQITD